MSELLRVLFRTGDLLVADKPATIATEPDRERGVSLRDLVDAELGKGGAAHAISRLDRGVTGCVTFAISAAAKRDLARFAPTAKRYVALAVATGVATAQEGVWSWPVEGREAASRFRRIARVEAAKHEVWLLALEPITGRTHQLRIHASRAGLALLGDGKYGGPKSLATRSGKVLSLKRPSLHAARVVLAGVEVLAPVPEDLCAIWSALDGAPEAWNEAVRCAWESSQR